MPSLLGCTEEIIPVILIVFSFDGVSIFFVESFQWGFVRNTVTGKLDPQSNLLYGLGQPVKLYLPLLVVSTMRLK